MNQLIGGALLLIVLVLVMILFRKPNCTTKSEMEAESTPAGYVMMFALIGVLVCITIIGAILVFSH